MAPSDQTLPTSNQTYTSVDLAKAAVDRTFTNASTSNAQNGGLNGKWSFSGWDEGTLEGTTVVFRGTWTFTEDKPPVDAEQPKPITLTDASYEVGKPAAALDGATTVGDGGTITYQWYQAAAADQTNGTQIHGETAATYTPDTSAVGTYYYYVIATNTKADATGKTTASTTSNIATITVTAKPVTYTVSYDWGTEVPDGENLPTDTGTYQSVQDAEAAVDETYTAGFISNAQKDGKDGTWTFSGWTASVEGTVVKFTGKWTFTETLKVDAAKPAAITLADASYTVGDNATALNGTTTAADGGEITYQWYEANSKDNQNGTLLVGKTTSIFTPDTTAAGTRFYYVVATNTNANATGEKTAETRSNTVQITVQEIAPVEMFTVRYEWIGEAPADAKLPQDGHTYDTEEQARAAMDTTYAVGSTSTAQKDGKDGTWTFSGWSAAVDGNTVTFTGTWMFMEKAAPVTPKPPVTPSRPSTPAKPSQNPNVRPTLPFTDVRAGAWYSDAVRYVYENGIMSGVREDTFAPNQDTTRGMITTMIHRIEQEPRASAANPFLDAQHGYYANAVRWAQQKGIVTGISETEFVPNAPMTREQLATVLYRYAKHLGRDTSKAAELNEFADRGEVSSYAREAMRWAVAEGLLSGVGNARLAPNAPATRAQVAVILYRFLRAG